MFAMLFAFILVAIVDPATYVGNVYGTARPHTQVGVFEHGVLVRSAEADADGSFLINNIPAPFDGRDYTIDCGDASFRARVLPGATMALEIDCMNSEWRYRHERPSVLNPPAALPAGGLAPHMTSYTRTVFATREGLVGGTTANGHVIVVNDRFAALPSRRALSTNFGHEKEVRVTYRGNTTVVPVWDIGPWNTHDDYWNPTIIRETFKDLPRGTPEAEVAFYSKYNGGLDERGRTVKTPAGIDLADGTFRIDLAMPDNDRVAVEYLWLDESGPATGNVTSSESIVDARIDDTTSGNSPIEAAEMFVDAFGENGSGIPLNAVDGAFDSATEQVRGMVDALPPGVHTIYVHGRDVFGNWGPAGTTTISVAGSNPRRRAVRHS